MGTSVDSWIHGTQTIADRIRLRGFEYVMANDGGYLSQICSAAELLAFLYSRALNIGPSTAPMIPDEFLHVPAAGRTYHTGARYNGAPGPELDRLFFSPAHYALVLYVTLIEVGRMAPEGLAAFNRDGSTVELIGAEHSPGFETTAGSLSQTLSQAGGVALARRLKGETGNVWVMMSDGEFQEGQTWEAIQALSFHELERVKVIVDVNRQQCDGPMDTVMTIEPLEARIASFGGYAVAVNAHDLRALDSASRVNTRGKPLFILAQSNPTQGIPELNSVGPMLHYLRFSSNEQKQVFQRAFEAMKRTISREA